MKNLYILLALLIYTFCINDLYSQKPRKVGQPTSIKQKFNRNSKLPKVQEYAIAKRGSTGRTITKNSTETMAIQRLRNNPLSNTKGLPNVKIKDPRWKGWTKMRYKDKSGTIIHFNRKMNKNGTFSYDDFKFKNQDHSTLKKSKNKKFKIKTVSNSFNKISKHGIIGKSPYSQFHQAAKRK